MTKFITLKMIISQELVRPDNDASLVPFRRDEGMEDTGEDDGLGNVVEMPTSGGQPEVEQPRLRITRTQPLTIGLDSIRNFYPRKHEAPGTRLVLKSGVAYIVEETHDEVLSAIRSA